jgi:hypothetical protein
MDADPSVVALPELVDALLHLLEPDDELGDGEEDPVEEQRGGDEERVPLRLHDGLLVAEVLGGGAGVLVVAGGARLVLPVDVHEQEEAEGHHRHHGLQRAPHHGDHAPAQAVEPRQRQQQQHDRLRARRVAQHHPLQRHGRRIEPSIWVEHGKGEEEGLGGRFGDRVRRAMWGRDFGFTEGSGEEGGGSLRCCVGWVYGAKAADLRKAKRGSSCTRRRQCQV